MSTIYQEYALLKARMKEDEVRLSELNAAIKEELEAAGEDETETPVGKFSLRKSIKSWNFSPELTLAEAELKEKQTMEKSKGIATPKTETVALYFYPTKDE